VLTHSGHWVQPPRCWATGPLPKPRWLPLPQLQYAQVVKQTRRRRLVAVRSRVVFGSLAEIKQVLATYGWRINTAFIERANLTLRQHVAAVGRRVLALQTRSRPAPAARRVSRLSQFLPAPCRFTAALTPARTDDRDGLSATLAAVYASDGRGVN